MAGPGTDHGDRIGGGRGDSGRRGSTRSIPVKHGRTALVEAAIRSIASRGAARTHPKDLADSLGLSKSLVNFHFGGRDGLIAEAIATSFERYVDLLWSAAESAGSDPVARLLAWVDEQIDWAAANPGIAAALNFPFEASSLQGQFDDDTRERIRRAGMRYFDNLHVLACAARAKVRRPDLPPVDSISEHYDTVILGWLALGVSVWNAGHHLPTRNPEAGRHAAPARDRLRSHLLEFLER